MKRLFVLFVLLLNVWTSYSYDFEVDGIQYDVISVERQTVRVVDVLKAFDRENPENKLVIPSSIQVHGRELTVTEIGSHAVKGNREKFYSCNFRSIILPATIETIGTCAFDEQTEVEELVLPSSLMTIGEAAFSHCTGLKKVTFNDRLQTIGPIAFYGCTQLQEIRLPQSVREIDWEAFRSTAISSFVFPDSLTKIGFGIFSHCKNLEYVDLEPLKHLGEIPFSGLFARSCVKRVIIPDWATYIPPYFVSECSEIEEFQFGENIERIGNYAFNKCTLHCNLVLPAKITEIGLNAFYFAQMPGTLVIPPTVVKLGWNVFTASHSDSLIFQEGESPISLSSVGSYDDYLLISSYSEYVRLDRKFLVGDSEKNSFDFDKPRISGKQIEIGKQFLTTNLSVLYGVNMNRRLTFLEGVEELKFKYYDSYTQNILLPSTLRTLQADIFTNETNLRHIDCRATVPPACDGKIVADNMYINATLTVPVGSKEAYQQAEGWKYFWNIRETAEAEFDPEHEGIRDLQSDDSQWFTIQDGVIHANVPIDLFTMDGQLLRHAAQGLLTDIPKGSYIIRNGARTVKVNLTF